MKNLILVLIALTFMAIHNISEHHSESTIRGPASSNPFSSWKSEKGHTFVFTYEGESFEVTKSGSGDVAYDKATDDCFDHFRKDSRDSDENIKIIDACANPTVKVQ